jgi:pilus assembly protein Flp/PilA
MERHAMTNVLMKLWKDEEGPTAVEYGLMLILITVALAAAVGTLGTRLVTIFGNTNTALTPAG